MRKKEYKKLVEANKSNYYKKLIDENKKDFKDYEILKDFINDRVQETDELEDREDDLHEYADGLVPIYYEAIIKEWQENPACRGEAEAQGLIEGVTDPYKIMQADLFTMYYDDLSGDYQTLINLVDDDGILNSDDDDDDDDEPEK